MRRLKKIIGSWRMIFAIVFLLAMLVAIRPNPWAEGVAILALTKDSAATLAGFENPKPGAGPMTKERILAMNNIPIKTEQDYYAFVAKLSLNETVQVKTTKTLRTLTTREAFKTIELNETELITVEEIVQENETINGTTTTVNKTINKTIEVPKKIQESLGLQELGFKIGPAPTSNLRKGLDLQGGTRVLLKPAEAIADDVFATVVDSMKERLNVYGLSDVLVAEISESVLLGGGQQKFILVEIAGATEQEVTDLLGKQGKFEATIGNNTVFKGGEDIMYVCRTAQCSGIDPQRGCGRAEGGWACSFQFAITLSPEAAQRQAALTKVLSVQGAGVNAYLSEPLVLFLDNQEVDRLSIAADLKGRAVTDISITGGGAGATEAEAVQDALNNMKRLQTILITGSLPVKIDIVKIDTISPVLGTQFLKNAFFTGLIAAIAVSLVLLIVYRKWVLAIPIIGTMLAEIFSILGLAALIGQNIDLAAIAGIIVTVGTGVNDQIVILDETIRKKKEAFMNWKEMFKRAFFIIFSAFATVVVAMIPLLFAGAGLLKGFAITTILGLCVGVFVTRPAYAALIQILFEE